MNAILECENIVIGAGVIGLAVASKISSSGETFLLESYSKFGQGTSSRNSEVVHSGIYYPKDSKKTQWCIEGREKLYEYCQKHQVPHRQTGKVLVATSEDQRDYLEKLAAHCSELKVPFRWISKDEIQSREPLVSANQGLYFERSGIVDSHGMMAALEKQCLDNNISLAYRHSVLNIEKSPKGWELEVQSGNERFTLIAQKVVNCAGLAAAELSQKALKSSRYEHRYCRGRYFVLSSQFNKKFKHLIYPVPVKDGLGVHVTIDLEGCARLGPDVDWAEDHSYENHAKLYDCDWEALIPNFLSAVQRYCPSVQAEHISAGLIGIRPKLFVDGQATREFLVEQHDGWIHCLGIESPGLTSSLAIAEEVQRLL